MQINFENIWFQGTTGSGKSHEVRKLFDGNLNPALHQDCVYLVVDPKEMEYKDIRFPNVTRITPLATDFIEEVDDFLGKVKSGKHSDSFCRRFMGARFRCYFRMVCGEGYRKICNR